MYNSTCTRILIPRACTEFEIAFFVSFFCCNGIHVMLNVSKMPGTVGLEIEDVEMCVLT